MAHLAMKEMHDIYLTLCETDGTVIGDVAQGILTIEEVQNEVVQQYKFMADKGYNRSRVTAMAPVYRVEGVRIWGDAAQDWIFDEKYQLGAAREGSMILKTLKPNGDADDPADWTVIKALCSVCNMQELSGATEENSRISFEIHIDGQPAYSTYAAIKITKQPESVDAESGDAVELSVTATGATAYQWQYCRIGASAWTNSVMTGAKTNKITVAVNDNTFGYKWRCVLSNASGAIVYTDEVIIYDKNMPRITAQSPATQVVKAGEDATVFVTAVNAEGYQWQNKLKLADDTRWADSRRDGATTDRLTFEMTQQLYDWVWRCVLTNGDNVVYSNTLTFTAG